MVLRFFLVVGCCLGDRGCGGGCDITREQVLKAFAKTIVLEPGESETVVFLMSTSSLKIWDNSIWDYAKVDGEFEFMIGASSRDIRLSHKLTVL